MARYAMVFDLDGCLGCKSCMIACKQENNVDIGIYWNKIRTVGPNGKYPDLEMYYMPELCQECENPPCVEVCPTGASYKRKDGITLIENDKCIGCESCIDACPYGARSMNSENIAVKCNLCAQKIDGGEKPACVDICPAKCRIFGDLDDPKSEASIALKKAGKNVYRLPDSGNKPSMAYVLTTLKWRM